MVRNRHPHHHTFRIGTIETRCKRARTGVSSSFTFIPVFPAAQLSPRCYEYDEYSETH